MKAIIIKEVGGIQNLLPTDLPVPMINENEVLVKVNAISINPVDVKARANKDVLSWLFGAERPVFLGWDISGVITETGKNVSAFTTGDEVFGMINFPKPGKAYAEYVAAPTSQIAVKPNNVSHKEAAAATLAALTAWQALVTNAKIKRGDRVLIHAASGGVGHFAVQIAKYLGAYVIGTSSAANKDFVMGQGADEHIDYTSQRFEEILKDIDFVLDTLAGGTTTKSIDVIKNGGSIISIPSPNLLQSDIGKAATKNVNLYSIMVSANGDDMKTIAHLLEKGIVKSHVSKTFSFDEMGKAHLHVETGKTVGKVVITI